MYLPESLHQANQDRKKSLLYTCSEVQKISVKSGFIVLSILEDPLLY
ncbi:uncharacterized protein RAG0_00464 [Rhynchosporium agropyri]|uniref:Uncharacterized protein n=1 Tax=Rhynchosporium agropyri TaxID=914238 RepID=A0A1E1JTG9_9HELO|nr:uncharacterized protein RAG0_00464 [Rhynchosporium agropyri]